MEALGFIETVGLLGAIEAADVMVKAADVRLLERQQSGGGLVTVTVTGEVSAVQAAVDAAVVALNRIEGAKLRSHHVIARPYDEIAGIIATLPSDEPEPVIEEEIEKGEEVEVSAGETERKTFTRRELQKMTVSDLRQLAGSLDGISLSDQAIKTAVKKKLIEAIIVHSNR